MREQVPPLHQCELCDYQPLEEFDVPGQCTLWHCPACGLYQQGQPADDASYAAHYHRGYMKHRAKKVRTALVRLNRFSSKVDVGKPRLLDIGCSVGCTVEAANRRGWLGVGVDVSDDMVEYCRQKGLDCYKTDTLQLPFADKSFDVVTAWHVVEHVADVKKTLAEWRRVLRPGGLLVLETPDANCRKARLLGSSYRKFWAAEHTYTFTRRTLCPFIEQAGFECLSRPWLGRMTNLSMPMTVYTYCYQGYQGARHATGLAKAFQVFARRVETAPSSIRRAA